MTITDGPRSTHGGRTTATSWPARSSELFALDVTAAVVRCRGCGTDCGGRDAARLRARARARRSVPGLRRRAAPGRPHARRGVARPRRRHLAAGAGPEALAGHSTVRLVPQGALQRALLASGTISRATAHAAGEPPLQGVDADGAIRRRGQPCRPASMAAMMRGRMSWASMTASTEPT